MKSKKNLITFQLISNLLSDKTKIGDDSDEDN